MKIKIKEQSLFASIACRVLKSKRVAAVFGNTIHLWNIDRENFLKSTAWVVHEIEHVRQFERYGIMRFAVLYLIESMRNGYHNNRFEVEAREVETGTLPDISGVQFI